MFAVLSPFLIYIHSVTGQWTLGAKLANNARIRDTLWDWVVLDNNEPFLRSHYALNPDWTQMADPYWGVTPWHRANMREAGSISSGVRLVERPDWRWLGVFAHAFRGAPVAIVPTIAWIFVILGLFFGPWNRARFMWWTFIVACVAPMLLLAVSLYVLPRHELPLVALFAVAFGKGADGLGAWLSRAAAKEMKRDGVLSALPWCPRSGSLRCILLLNRGIALNRAGNVTGGVPAATVESDMRALAEDLKSRVPAGSTLMSNEPWLAVWAGLDWRVAPMASPSALADYARSRHIDFALLRPWHFTDRENTTALEPFYIGRLNTPDVWLLFDFPPLRTPPRPQSSAAGVPTCRDRVGGIPIHRDRSPRGHLVCPIRRRIASDSLSVQIWRVIYVTATGVTDFEDTARSGELQKKVPYQRLVSLEFVRLPLKRYPAEFERVHPVADLSTSNLLLDLRTATPVSRLMATIFSNTIATRFGASPSDGSSSIRSFGFGTSARAIATICCSPPESFPASCLSRSLSAGNISSTSAIRRFASCFGRGYPPIWRFSITERSVNTRFP